jgi:hypothetical protein
MKICLKTSFVVVALLVFSILAFDVDAATITSCTLDRTVYNRGEIGYISVTVYNNKDDVIRVFEATAAIDYFYADGTVYLQTFFTNATLPIEIAVGQSLTFYIPFSLPTNIASGYTQFFVRAKTALWDAGSEEWYYSDYPTAEPVLYVESPYKQQFLQQEAVNEQLDYQIGLLEERLQNLQTAYDYMTLWVYVLAGVMIALGAAMFLLMRFIWKSRGVPQVAPSSPPPSEPKPAPPPAPQPAPQPAQQPPPQ